MVMKKLGFVIALAVTATVVLAEVEQSEDELKSLLSEKQVTNGEYLSGALQEAIETVRNNNPGGIYAKTIVNTDPSKINALKGTWTLTYAIGDVSYTDKLVIDQNYTSTTNGEIMGKGLYYMNNNGSGELVLCGYDPSVWGSVNADYACMIGSAIYQIFAFKFSGNVVTGGYYGIGTSSSSVVSSLMLKNKPLTGTRVATSVPTPTPVSVPVDEYDTSTGKLILPNVKVGKDQYSAVLINQGNDLFKIQSSTKK
jgi:hypothetical protein